MMKEGICVQTTNEKLDALRQAMKLADIQAYLIPSSDPHMSEYLPDHWRTRAYFSGFTGSAGTLIITQEESGLWTDGRYFIQAERQLSGSEIVLYRMGEKNVPTVKQFLKDRLSANQTLGLDGMVAPASLIHELNKQFVEKQIQIRDVDLTSALWPDRPAIPCTPVFQHDVAYAGQSAKQKIEVLREKLRENKATATLVTGLPAVAWLLNLRAADVKYNPFVLGYCFISASKAVFFVDPARLEAPLKDALASEGVSVEPYDSFLSYLKQYSEDEKIYADDAQLTYALYSALDRNPHFEMIPGADLVNALKAVKNPVEIENLIYAHKKDGCAMVRFQMELERRMAKGETISELDIGEMLKKYRFEQPKCMGESFSTIAAYGGNAAMMHYSPTKENHAVLEPHGFLLVDSGAHYLDGTTDITRTYALGDLTQEEKEFYTYVLRSNLSLNQAVFMEGCSGANLDILARSAVWAHGIDYRCGTGHGVGFFGAIHEGPHSMRVTNTVPFVPGMLVTDEPGIYEEGRVGIRIENELLCVERMETAYGRFYGFDAVTFCPIDVTPVLPELLGQEQIDSLNAYHEKVYRELSPMLNQEECQWLKSKTAPIGK